MEQRIVNLQIKNEYIIGSGVSVGSVGSHDDVLLEMDFRGSFYWAGTTRRAIFSNALGESRTPIILGTNLLEEGQTEVYLVPVPQEAKHVAGECFLTVEGFVTDADGKEIIRCVTEEARFRVLPSKIYTNDRNPVTPSQAEQLQSEIDEIKQTIVDVTDSKEYSAEKAELAGTHALTSESWAVGQKNGKDVEETDPAYQNNAKYWSKVSMAEEPQRQKNENLRVYNEAVRVSAETARDAAEKARDEAEKERAAAYPSVIQTVTAARDSALSASASAQEAKAALEQSIAENPGSTVIDPTLSVAGAAAEAVAVGQLKNDMVELNCRNLISAHDGNAGMSNGITYTKEPDGSVSISGTSTYLSLFNYYYDLYSLPDWMEKGKTYRVRYYSENVVLKIWFYKEGEYSVGYSIEEDRKITVPMDAEGLIIRLQISAGTTVSETVHPYILDAYSNKELGAQIDNLEINKRNITPTLSSVQKSEIKALIDNYLSIENQFTYNWSTTRLSYANTNCWDDAKEKFKICCNTFVELILMGRSHKDFDGKNGSNYSSEITKAFDWGFYESMPLRLSAFNLAKRQDDEIVGYYGYASPYAEESTSYSYNTYYNKSQNLHGQSFHGYLTAAALSWELERLGCVIPLSEVQTGDVLFFTRPIITESDMYSRTAYKNITHTALVYDTDGLDITIADCGTISVLHKYGTASPGDEERAAAVGRLTSLVMCCRNPCAFGHGGNVPSSITRK